jgi:hypothetical protein
MNDRIKELERECWEPRKHPVSQAAMGDKFNTEKFAASIVRECAKFLEDNSGYDDANNAWHPEPEDLLNHFGVKE